MASLASRLPQHKDVIANTESLRLKIILRLIEIVDDVQGVSDDLIHTLTAGDLDRFFESIEKSWRIGGVLERNKLHNCFRRLLHNDQDGVLMDKVLTIFWNVAHSEDVSTEELDLALENHLQFLDYPGVQDRDALKNAWLDKWVVELKNNTKWILLAFNQIRKISCLISESLKNSKSIDDQYLNGVVHRLQTQHNMCTLTINSIENYINEVRKIKQENPEMDEMTLLPHSRYNHATEVQERLDFYTFSLRDAGYVLNLNGAKRMWQNLGQEPVFLYDRQACLKWFTEMISSEISLIREDHYKDIFELIFAQLDPRSLTNNGFLCFEKFFKKVNTVAGKLEVKNGTILLDDLDLIGKDYLWRIITNSQEDIANLGISLMVDVHKNPGFKLNAQVWKFHMTFVANCTSRFQKQCDSFTNLIGCGMLDKSKMMDEDTYYRLFLEGVKFRRIKEVLKLYSEQYNIALPVIE